MAYNWFPADIDRPIDMALQTLVGFLVYHGVVHFRLDIAVLRNQKKNLYDQKKNESDQSRHGLNIKYPLADRERAINSRDDDTA